jgi:hypothetical protein
MTTGIVISGSRIRWVLIRGIGPSLAQFGVAKALPDLQVTVFSNGLSAPFVPSIVQSSQPRLSYDRVAQVVGAFPISDTSADALLVMQLGPGAYAIQCSSTGENSGDVLTECDLIP